MLAKRINTKYIYADVIHNVKCCWLIHKEVDRMITFISD